MTCNGRTLPHIAFGDRSLRARGFITDNYMEGLSFQACAFHAIAGREGSIDTAIKTSETGYIQRRIIKAMEDITVEYDNTVRNSSGSVVQFVYGSDSMDPSMVESQRLPHGKSLPESKFRCKYLWKNSEMAGDQDLLLERRKLIRDRKSILEMDDESVIAPVNIYRMIRYLKTEKRKGDASDLTPSVCASKIRALHRKIGTMLPPGCDHEHSAFSLLLRAHLCSKRVVLDYKFTVAQLTAMCLLIEKKFAKCMITPGDMVGSIAGQSVGEPSTQMTLNTSHFIGMTDKNMTLGVPRLKELVGATKKMKTPFLTVHLMPDVEKNKTVALAVQENLDCLRLSDIVMSYQIHYDPTSDTGTTRIPEDESLVFMFHSHPDTDCPRPPSPRDSHYIIRLVLDGPLLTKKTLPVVRTLFDRFCFLTKYAERNREQA